MENEKPRILYVDDEANNLTAFVASFRRYYQIFTATSPQAGLEILKREKIHVIVTDQRMPQMTGVQFLEAIIPEYPDTMRMILTGFTDVEAIINAINSGRVLRYITKPWDAQELKLILDGALKIYNLEQKNRELILELQQQVLEQQRIMNLFKKYVPENVVKETLASDVDQSIMRGENRIISVMFVDIRGFTAISSRFDPSEAVELLNDYFLLMCQCIKDHKGSINKFLGDGILAIFGAPISSMNNQENAVYCGLDMLKTLGKLNEKYAAKVGHDIRIGIGINTGEVIVGNIGTEDRVEYTVIGDTVNVAERLEELTKEASNNIFISESTYNEVADRFEVESLGPQIIRGKTEPIKVYRVIKARNNIATLF